jgi:hypothetical protein
MADAEISNRAQEAQSLDANDTLQEALKALRLGALETLATIDPTDLNAIMAIQADIRSIDNFRGSIKAMILAGKPQKHTPVA